MPHHGKGRAILPGQKIHASVAFKSTGYTPKATFVSHQFKPSWEELVGKGPSWNSDRSGAGNWAQYLEMDLFDYTAGSDAIMRLTDTSLAREDVLHILQRLDFMAMSGDLQT